ncbi:FUSC family protein [Tsukamurella sp. 1534]|uniref:FUSC family protein n=1 Tax=Tsukamurella sp. 1534 TaxID=1151061 RepID=UPI0002ECF7C0|nr:FUSC family protein [Tsukamurella sp. 1534]
MERVTGTPEPDPLPQVARMRSIVFARPMSGPWRWGAGLRAAAAVAIPGTAMVAAGHAAAALFTTFGAFAVLYGEGRAYRVRAQVVATAGVALVLGVAIGTALGETVPHASTPIRIASVLMVAVPGVVAVYVIDALRLGPPGALFFAIVGSGALVATESGADPRSMIAAAALGVLSSILVSMAGALTDSSGPQRAATGRAVGAVDAYLAPESPRNAAQRNAAGSALIAAWTAMDDARAGTRPADAQLIARLREATHRVTAADDDSAPAEFDPTREVTTSSMQPTVRHRLGRSLTLSSHATITALRVGVACLVAGLASLAIGLDRPHWAAISSLVVLQAGVDRVHGTARGLQRFLGTAIGLVLYAAIYAVAPGGYALIAIVAVLQFSIEILVTRNYAAAVVVITPVALLASGAGVTDGDALPVIRDRLVETVIGVIVAFLAMYFVAPRAHRRTFAWTAARVRTVGAQLVALASSADTAAAREAARCLHFELEGCTRSGIDSAHNEPGWTTARWPAQAGLVHAGYDLLAAYWRTPGGDTLPDARSWRSRFPSP